MKCSFAPAISITYHVYGTWNHKFIQYLEGFQEDFVISVNLGETIMCLNMKVCLLNRALDT